MSNGETETKMQTLSPMIQKARAAYATQVAELTAAHRAAMTARETGDWAALDTTDYIGKN